MNMFPRFRLQPFQRTAAAGLSLIFLLSLPFGCGKKTDSPPKPQPAAQETVKTTPAPPTVETAETDTATVPHISDIHFNPFYDTSLVKQLIDADVSQWENIFATSKLKDLGSYGGTEETNALLLDSALADMAKTSDNRHFILFTGDFIAHDFHTRFEPYSKEPAQLDAFINKTISYVCLKFRKHFPKTPIYVSLGNNDSYAGDYAIIPGGAFLKWSAQTLSQQFLVSHENRAAFAETYPVGGYFTVTPPQSPNTVIISLNSILFSIKHKNTLDYDPAARQLDWFEKQLQRALQKNQKVWVLLHIPPGPNVYSTVHKKTYIPMWKDQYNNRFIQLSKKYASIITASYCGHIHMDNFQLLLEPQGSGEARALALVRVCPAISPQFGNNPGYQHLVYDGGTFCLTDYVTHYLDLDLPAAQQQWRPEYSFKEAYGQENISPAALTSVYKAILEDDAVRKLYMNYFNVSNPSEPQITEDNWKAYWCGIGKWTKEGFEMCNGGPAQKPTG